MNGPARQSIKTVNTSSFTSANAAMLAQTATDAQTEFIWTDMPAGVGVFLLVMAAAAVLYGVFYLYQRESDTCPRSIKLFLAAVRAAVLLTLAVIFLGPSTISVRTRVVHPLIALLRDATLSMNTADRYGDTATAASAAALLEKTPEQLAAERPTRAAVLNAVLARNDHQLLRGLSRKGRVRVVDFAQQSSTVDNRSVAGPTSNEAANPPANQPQLPDLVPTGRGTDLAAAIREAVQSENPAAVLLFSDGQHTGKDDPREAAREAREQGIPLLVVGVGDPSRPRDLRIANVYVRPQIWSDEPFEVEAVVLAQGIEGGEANVELIEKRLSESDSSPSAGTVVARQSIAIPASGGRINCQFSHTVKEEGRYVYSVRVEPIDDEISEQDNQLDSQIAKVLSREKVRVLLVAGAPTWEFRMVEKLLQREKSMTVSCWLQTLDEGRAQEGSRPITHLPITKEELFWYDVVLLFDPNPKEFDQEWMELLKQFVGEHAGGLLYMAGPKFSDAMLTNSRTSNFRDVLPVRFGDVGAMAVSSLLSTNSQSWPLKVAPTGMDHPVMTFYSDRQETLQRWETLPGIFWSFPSLEAKPTAQVLVEHSDPTLRSVEGSRPLMVSGRYGAGQVLYLGFNGTWRWRKAGSQAEFFDKFWIQAVRYLVESRSLEGRRRGSVQTDRDRYEIGDKVAITARLQDASYQPLSAERVEATWHEAGESPTTVQLIPVPNQPGTYEATLVPRTTGQHVLRVAIPGAAAEEASIESPFQVELPSVETSQVWLNKPLLVDLAELSGPGGRYFDLSEIDQVVAAVPDKTQVVETRSPPEPLWDIPEVLIALVVLLGIEWAVRKRNKLL
jgi:uncharacterized membrane protein